MNVDDNKGLQEKSHLKQRVPYSHADLQDFVFLHVFLNNFHSGSPARQQKAQAAISPSSVCDCVNEKARRKSTVSGSDQYTNLKTDPTLLDAVRPIRVEDCLSSTLFMLITGLITGKISK